MSITLGPITLFRREDGTISSARETITEAFTSPSGRETTETYERDISLADVDTALGAAYAQFDTHNRALEGQLADEREAHTALITAKDAKIAELYEALRVLTEGAA